MDNPIDYKFIKKWMGHGEIGSMAEKHGISRGSASRILSGKGRTSNQNFVRACYDKALENAQIYLSYLEKARSITEALKKIDPENEKFY